MPIRSRILLFCVFLLLLSASASWAELSLTGALRNDAAWVVRESGDQFVDLLENKWIIENKAEVWRFYGDLRISVLSGALAGSPDTGLSGSGLFAVRIPRAFIRYSSALGVFSLGKTYANFGVPGLFNPFELNLDINVTDLAAVKEGIIALTWELPLNDLSSLQAFAGPAGNSATATGGLALNTHVWGFDLGAALLRRGANQNLAGLFFKGDLEIEVQGALAWHADDQGRNGYGEAMAGVDYSFLDGEWLAGAQVSVQGLPAGPGAGSSGAVFSATGSFSGRQHLYAWLQYMPDQFFQVRADAFWNLEDNSNLLIPSATWVLADGLSATLLAVVPTGPGGAEFGHERLGRAVLDARVEAKF